mgnify:CR=1 FL=1|tara:strand:- start:345 stop:626 length:282 start_codon:yes stop_codon:yes gene_type:complete
MNIISVIEWKFPGIQGVVTRDDVITEYPGDIPSQKDLDAWIAEYEAYLAATAYQRERAAAYPEIVDQLDKIYHEGIDAWKDQIKTVKDKYPKP